MKRSFVALVLWCTACTPGAFGTSGGLTPSSNVTSVTTIDVDLTNDPGGPDPAGPAAGYKPLLVTLAVGQGVRFTNSDGFAHTATSISGTSFPSAYPFTDAALQRTGATLSGGFSTGSLPAGTSSQTIVADRAGTYIFGCFYHYGSPMRAEIDVR